MYDDMKPKVLMRLQPGPLVDDPAAPGIGRLVSSNALGMKEIATLWKVHPFKFEAGVEFDLDFTLKPALGLTITGGTHEFAAAKFEIEPFIHLNADTKTGGFPGDADGVYAPSIGAGIFKLNQDICKAPHLFQAYLGAGAHAAGVTNTLDLSNINPVLKKTWTIPAPPEWTKEYSIASGCFGKIAAASLLQFKSKRLEKTKQVNAAHLHT